MSKNIYLLDSDTLISASRNFYSFDICPGFWDSLIKGHNEGRIKSIDKVKKEIEEGNYEDHLKKWIHSNIPNSFFCSTDNKDVIAKFGLLVNWAENQPQFHRYAKTKFMSDKADAWLIAYALSFSEIEKWIVCTFEKYEPTVKKKVKIPNVCKAFNVDYEDAYFMLRDLQTRLILEQQI